MATFEDRSPGDARCEAYCWPVADLPMGICAGKPSSGMRVPGPPGMSTVRSSTGCGPGYAFNSTIWNWERSSVPRPSSLAC